MTRRRIIIVDDHPLFRAALRQTLAGGDATVSVEEAGDLSSLSTALDADRERRLLTALRSGSDAPTLLIIAHRLSTVAGAANILVVENGELVEQGNHTALMAGQGRYFSMWSAQQRVKQWNIAGR